MEEVIVTGRFIGSGATSATKLDIPVRDTPYSVASYTDAFMRAIETTKVADLYRYMTGVQRAGNTGYDLAIRGFKASGTDRNALMVDGLPGLTVRFGSPPTVGTDHIELVKGPASILYGQVQPGGFVNIITKKPRDEAANVIGLRGTSGLASNSSDNVLGYEVTADLTGPVDAEKRVLYRLITEYGYDNTFRTASYERPIYLSPSVTWRITDSTVATVLLEYRSVKTSYDTYMVAPNLDASQIPATTTRYQSPSDVQKEWGGTATLLLQHKFSNDIKLNLSYRGVVHRDTAIGYDVNAILPNQQEVSIRARNQLNKREYHFGDLNLVAPFETGPFQHKLVVGTNLGRETLDTNRLQFFNIPTTPATVAGPHAGALNIFAPSYVGILPRDAYPLVNPTTPTALNDRYTSSQAYGGYLADLITITENWKAQFGIRYARERQSLKELRIAGVPTTASDNDDVLPQGGLIYQPSKDWSFYGSYSTSFVPAPASSQDINGTNPFVPTTAHAIEFGVKADLFNNRANATLAWFKIDKQNVLSTFSGGTCPASIGTCSQQVGAERSTGVEFEVSASPLDNWQLTVGYGYTDAKVVKSTIVQQNGAALTNIPKHNAHLWTRYDLADGMLAGLGFGLGIAYTGDRPGLLPTATSNSPLTLPSYTVVDLGLYYVAERYDLTFKISNLFDRRYFESTGFTGQTQIVPGQPRIAVLSARVRF
ncbi:ferrichrome-iron receptor [Rhodospirillales bacterium TMPK1]|uniref:Ferrichrome-iron receptor n=2 Tax=Roseiterribacter gracilis TaxID=2812848 RepID=A0A8S8XAZ1_9PROT|nr:ferrichrome-iron receptor [Rhodospirillales bacterium TMPK1]